MCVIRAPFKSEMKVQWNLKIVEQLRQQVQVDTLNKLYLEEERDRLRKKTLENCERWKSEIEVLKKNNDKLVLRVIAKDWGVATLEATKEFGEVFACLNMANEETFGGGYVAGTAAQEENMFRRTDCHFSHPKLLKESKEIPLESSILLRTEYNTEEIALISSFSGECYLDLKPRICIKDKEKREEEDFGYGLLKEEEIFCFYELRSAALDLKDPKYIFLEDEIRIQMNRKKIKAQLDTLIKNGIEYVILSAFGCGAFNNDATEVAIIYKEEIEKVKENFKVIIFAIYYGGYGNDNFTPFNDVLMSPI